MGENNNIGRRIIAELLDLVKIFVICFVAVYLLTNFVAKPIRVEGSSMYPTLKDGEIGITNVFSVKFQSVDRFDVVIIYNEERGEYWVKRIIGIPGDTLESKNDVLTINGEEVEQYFLDEAYVADVQQEGLFTSDFGPVTLGEDEYWLMGDNRIRSEDSRMHGPFHSRELIGKDVLVLYPFGEIQYVHNTGDAE